MFNRGGIGSIRHFPCKFPHKMRLVTHFDCAGSHKKGVGIRVRHFPCKLPHIMPLVTCHDVHVHFDCAGLHKTMSPEVSPVVFIVNFHTKWLLCFVHAHFDCAGLHKAMSPGVSVAIFPVNFPTTGSGATSVT